MTNKNLYLILIIWLGILLLLSPLLLLDHGDVVLYIYKKRTSFTTIFFKWITYIGSTYVYLIFFFYYLKVDKRKVYGLILTAVLHGIIVIGMKRTIFEWTPRPVKFFEEKYVFDLIEGISYPSYDSFPSGHTATAFAFIIYLLLIQKKKFWVPIGFFIALLVGLSRIYLLQHFFVDVYTGAIVGGLSAFTTYAVGKKYNWIV